MRNGHLLDGAATRRLENLQLTARTVAEGALSGLHRSAHHGVSVEFAEHKEYAPGDELRHVDWRAYGRVDKFYVKRYEEETELRGFLLLDTSGSMGYGRPGARSKLDYGKVLCAAMAYVLLRQQDHVGLLGFGGAGRGGPYLPPRGHGGHLSDLCGLLEGLRPEPAGPASEEREGLPRALTHLSEVARRRALVVLVSDLLPGMAVVERGGPEAVAAHGAALRALLRGLRARRHDVLVLQVLDPDELELPFEGTTWFEELEPAPGAAARRLLVDPADVRARYQEEVRRYLQDMRQGLLDGDIEYQMAVTNQPPEEVLLEVLRGPLRAGRRRR